MEACERSQEVQINIRCHMHPLSEIRVANKKCIPNFQPHHILTAYLSAPILFFVSTSSHPIQNPPSPTVHLLNQQCQQKTHRQKVNPPENTPQRPSQSGLPKLFPARTRPNNPPHQPQLDPPKPHRRRSRKTPLSVQQPHLLRRRLTPATRSPSFPDIEGRYYGPASPSEP